MQILMIIIISVLYVFVGEGQTKINKNIYQSKSYLSELESIGFNGSVLVEFNSYHF
jgi:predicted TIM-barrel fold metal-dependent hydrolase